MNPTNFSIYVYSYKYIHQWICIVIIWETSLEVYYFYILCKYGFYEKINEENPVQLVNFFMYVCIYIILIDSL